MKGTDYLAGFLRRQGVKQVFEVVGGMITHALDSLHSAGGIRVVSVHHEQGAAFAADAVGRLTGTPGVAMATSGPGATNLLTGIGSCYFDSSPAVFITGQVNRSELKGERRIRQLGFQELDIVAMARPITKAAWRVDSPAELPARLAEAFALAREGRPGPVLLDIPMDVQRADVTISLEERPRLQAPPAPAEGEVARCLDRLARSKRPLILVGGGLRAAGARDIFRPLAHRLGVPSVHSLMAVDALPAGHPLRAGMIGSYGNRWANLAVGRADFLLVLGSRLDIRQTGSDPGFLSQGREIIHVDCEPGEINNRVQGCRPILASLDAFLETALRASEGRSFPDRAGWLAEIAALKAEWPDSRELDGVKGINPNLFMHQLSAASGAAGAYIVDVGQHQMWAAQSLDLGPEQRFLTSGGMGAMGFALPASIGAALSCPGRPVVVIAGDGGFQLNIQELQTIVRNGLPVKIVVINNGCHGMVRQFQQSYFKERYHSTLWGYSAPDFERVALSYGIAAATVREPEDVARGLARLWADPGKPHLLQVMVDTAANAYPKIAFGHPLTEMEPFAKPLEMEGT